MAVSAGRGASFRAVVLGMLLAAVLALPGLAHARPAEAGPGAATGIALPVEVSADGVLVRAEDGLDTLAARIAADAPGQLVRIREDLAGLPTPRVVDIRLVKRAQDMGRAAPPGRGAPTWASGVAYPDLGVVVVATRRGADPIDVPRVVEHELAHLALGAALRGRAPRWLDEGFAFLHASEWSMGRTYTLTGMAWTGQVIPLLELDTHFGAHKSAVDRAYAQSYDFVAYLARRGRYPDTRDDGDRWPFQRFLAEIADGRSAGRASWEAYGAGLSELFEEWRTTLRERYLVMPSGLFALGLWVLAALLLVLGYLRRRRLNRSTLARWEREEAGLHQHEDVHGPTLH